MASRREKQKERKAKRTKRRDQERAEAAAKAKAGPTRAEIDREIRLIQRDFAVKVRRGKRRTARKKAAWRNRRNRKLRWRNLNITNRSGLRPLPWGSA